MGGGSCGWLGSTDLMLFGQVEGDCWVDNGDLENGRTLMEEINDYLMLASHQTSIIGGEENLKIPKVEFSLSPKLISLRRNTVLIKRIT